MASERAEPGAKSRMAAMEAGRERREELNEQATAATVATAIAPPPGRLIAHTSRVEDDFAFVADEVAAKRQKLQRPQGAPGRIRHGSLADILARSTLPKGPATAEELFDYPTEIVKVIFACPERALRVRQLLANGILETSDYSGMHCEGEAKRLMLDAMATTIGFEPPFYKVSRCCDNNATCQKVLRDISQEIYNSEMCVAKDINDYISEEATRLLDELEPDPSSDKDIKIMAYSSMGDWIMDNAKSVYLPNRHCECLVHGEQCPVFGKLAAAAAAAAGASSDSGGASPLRLNSAGTICKDWSTVGRGDRSAGRSERTHAVWLGERKMAALAGDEDLFFGECTRMYNAQTKLAVPLASTHRVISASIGPEVLGHPTRRTRTLSAGLSLESLLWLGPESADDIQSDFEALFARSSELNGSVYFAAGQDSIRRFAAHAMRRRGIRVDIGDIKKTHGRSFLESFLPAGCLQRMSAYLSKKSDLQAMDGTFIVDLEQWPCGKAGAAGPYFPSLLTHGTIVDLNTYRIALGSDHLSALGFHMQSVDSRSKVTSILGGLSDIEQKALAGNGQSLPAIMAWVLYVFAHIVRRPALTITPALRTPGAGEDPDAEDGEEELEKAQHDGDDDGQGNRRK